MKVYAVIDGEGFMYGPAGALSYAKERLKIATIDGIFGPYRIVTIEDYEPEVDPEDELIEISGFEKPRTRTEWRSVLARKERKLAPKISAENRIREAIDRIRKAIGEPEVSDE